MAVGQRCMVVLVVSKQLAQIRGHDAPRGITEVLLSLAGGDDNVAAHVPHTLGPPLKQGRSITVVGKRAVLHEASP